MTTITKDMLADPGGQFYGSGATAFAWSPNAIRTITHRLNTDFARRYWMMDLHNEGGNFSFTTKVRVTGPTPSVTGCLFVGFFNSAKMTNKQDFCGLQLFIFTSSIEFRWRGYTSAGALLGGTGIYTIDKATGITKIYRVEMVKNGYALNMKVFDDVSGVQLMSSDFTFGPTYPIIIDSFGLGGRNDLTGDSLFEGYDDYFTAYTYGGVVTIAKNATLKNTILRGV